MIEKKLSFRGFVADGLNRLALLIREPKLVWVSLFPPRESNRRFIRRATLIQEVRTWEEADYWNGIPSFKRTNGPIRPEDTITWAVDVFVTDETTTWFPEGLEQIAGSPGTWALEDYIKDTQALPDVYGKLDGRTQIFDSVISQLGVLPAEKGN